MWLHQVPTETWGTLIRSPVPESKPTVIQVVGKSLSRPPSWARSPPVLLQTFEISLLFLSEGLRSACTFAGAELLRKLPSLAENNTTALGRSQAVSDTATGRAD